MGDVSNKVWCYSQCIIDVLCGVAFDNVEKVLQPRLGSEVQLRYTLQLFPLATKYFTLLSLNYLELRWITPAFASFS